MGRGHHSRTPPVLYQGLPAGNLGVRKKLLGIGDDAKRSAPYSWEVSMPACRECAADPTYGDPKLLCPHLRAGMRRDEFVSSLRTEAAAGDGRSAPAAADNLVWHGGRGRRWPEVLSTEV